MAEVALGPLIANLLQTCKMNCVDPVAWPPQTFERIANQWPGAEIHSLMPWIYRA
jgi:transposase